MDEEQQHKAVFGFSLGAGVLSSGNPQNSFIFYGSSAKHKVVLACYLQIQDHFGGGQ
jgi:hypothetical protein